MPAALTVITFIPKELLGFVYWWYFQAPVQFLLVIVRLLQVYLDLFAVPLMIRTLFTPMFHDYTFVGRILSFVFRVIRIFIGLIVNLLFSTVLVIFFFTWLCLPVIITLGVIYSFRGLI